MYENVYMNSCTVEDKEGTEPLGTRVIKDCETSDVGTRPNSGPMQEV